MSGAWFTYLSIVRIRTIQRNTTKQSTETWVVRWFLSIFFAELGVAVSATVEFVPFSMVWPIAYVTTLLHV